MNDPTPSSADITSGVTARRVFELFVTELESDVEHLDEALLVRLRWFVDDIEIAVKRLAEDPTHAYEIITGLSAVMQDLDSRAGASEQAHKSLIGGRRWLMLIPEPLLKDGETV